MCEATGTDLPTSPVIPDIEMGRGGGGGAKQSPGLLGHENQVKLVISRLSGSGSRLMLLNYCSNCL